jgi:hypothetical protein
MKTKLITDDKDYWILISTDESLTDDKYPYEWGNGQKVLAYRKKNKEADDIPVPLLPELPKQEEDVELGKACLAFVKTLGKDKFESNERRLDDFIEGYKAASKKYSEEEIENAFKKGFAITSNPDTTFKNFMSTLQSLSPTLAPIDFIPEYEDSKEYEILPLPDKPKEGMRVVKGTKVGIIRMHRSNHDGSWQWAEIPEISWWNPSELKQVVYKKQLKIVKEVLQGKWIFKN